MLEFNLPRLIEVNQLAQLQQAALPERVVLIDLSNQAMYHQAHIQGAIHVPYQQCIFWYLERLRNNCTSRQA